MVVPIFIIGSDPIFLLPGVTSSVAIKELLAQELTRQPERMQEELSESLRGFCSLARRVACLSLRWSLQTNPRKPLHCTERLSGYRHSVPGRLHAAGGGSVGNCDRRACCRQGNVGAIVRAATC